jgi:alpha-D-xyloside xylohydrolase
MEEGLNMKFMNGYWVPGNGFKTGYAAHAYDVTVTPNSIKVLAAVNVIRNRGMTLNSTNLEITYSSTAQNVIKVHIAHFRGGVDKGPHFELNENQSFDPSVTENDDCAELVRIQE